MAARSLVQALEGVQFPCDRERLIEYARRQEASPRSLDALYALPDRQFRDMTELFSALPSKHEIRRRATVVRMEPRPSRSEQAQPDQEPEREPERRAERPKSEAGYQSSAEEATPPPVAAPLQNDPEADEQPPLDPLSASMQWYRASLEMWPEWVRMSQRLWFPWLK